MERLTVLLVALLAAAVGGLAFVTIGLRARVAALEAERDDEPARVVPFPTGDAARLERRIAELEQRTGRTTPEGSESSPPGDGEPTGDAAAELDRRVADAVERELGRRDDPLADKNPRLGAVAKALGFTDVQSREAEREIDLGKREAFEVLDLPRPDGESMFDVLIRTIAEKGDEKAAEAAWWPRLVIEKVPGRNETYLTALQRIEDATWKRLERVLDVDQLKRLKESDVEILEMKTAYEPFKERLADPR